ncbi:hypothetical protein [Rubinisphaera italica]|uniref:Uncharacterized protein n=1 Tax=Rubinisphaera italica TaxID=2527969 RepID=A0A5C5XPA3_9PLAN|nr:hypothetical protein [Rubinisphaera italica]TWT63612.1 hypothetical protein Pan54_43660 [Rubinisphaera italica]
MNNDWDDLEEQARERIINNSPKCLNPFRITRVDDPTGRSDIDLVTTWGIACKCDNNIGQVLGYSLKDFNKSYNGPLQFVRPLHFECGKCGLVSLIIDEHGFNSEVAQIEGGIGSATYRGTGETSPFHCHMCEATSFEVMTSFIYSDGAFDLFVEAPELPPENFFDLFEARGKCIQCGKVNVIASFEG